MMYNRSPQKKDFFNKITIFIIASAFIAVVLVIRLFQLQVLAHDYYQDLATKGQYGNIELPAQRGEIIITDYHSGEEFLLATNTTLNLVYADPALIKDPAYITDHLAPLLFDLEEEIAKDEERIKEAAKSLPPDLTEEEIQKLLKPLSDKELEQKFYGEMLEKISKKQRTEILLTTELDEENGAALKALNINGIEVFENFVYAYPPQISNKEFVAEAIADYVQIPAVKLAQILQGQNRYVVLKKKLQPEISREIERLFNEADDGQFNGIGLQEEYFRYYPEAGLGANIVGYVSHDNIGQYGIESSFNSQLKGTPGSFQAKRDSIGRQITVGESIIEPAVDGDNIVLTIDRSIQLQTEKILAEAVEFYQADSGQIIIMDPQTGAITAMAHYPSFDPNSFGQVFKKIEVEFTEEEIEELYPANEEGVYYFYTNPITLDKYTVFEEVDEEGNVSYWRYENFVGPEVYHNKIVAWPYEPGSVFKTIAMASAIDDGTITPNTTYNDVGPVGVDFNIYSQDFDFEIKNADGYFGLVNMQTVLAQSLNTGMTFIAKEMGPALYYSYLKKFGFLDRTDIELDSEAVGRIKYYEDWTESELATSTFGQGITVTMLQVANAYSAIVNGGILMKPHIISEVRHDDGTVTEYGPQEIRRVLSEDTASKMTQMLVYAVEEGVAETAAVDTHFIGGKTGTSQTYKYGKALSGKGTTTATFAGFGPIDDPKFVILVKLDRPRLSEWGSATAAPTFKKLAEYLFNSYNIPPDKIDENS